MDSGEKLIKAHRALTGLSLPGFSLIEILVAIAIVALMATQVPRLTRVNYNRQEKLVSNLNMLARNACTHALLSGKITQLFFDFSATPARVSIRQETDKKEGAHQKTVFDPVSSPTGNDSFIWDDSLKIERFIIEGKDEAAGGNLKTVWIYIMPDGIAQQATLTVRDDHTQQVSQFQLNPFFVQFRVL